MRDMPCSPSEMTPEFQVGIRMSINEVLLIPKHDETTACYLA